jgi:hypothetical protein
MQSLLLQNLKLTIPTALAFTVVGYAISVPMSFYLDAYAARWQFNLIAPPTPGGPIEGIEAERLNTLREFQTAVALGGAFLGVVVAQTTFVVHTLVDKGKHKSEG